MIQEAFEEQQLVGDLKTAARNMSDEELKQTIKDIETLVKRDLEIYRNEYNRRRSLTLENLITQFKSAFNTLRLAGVSIKVAEEITNNDFYIDEYTDSVFTFGYKGEV